jgi:hypothetical protein
MAIDATAALMGQGRNIVLNASVKPSHRRGRSRRKQARSPFRPAAAVAPEPKLVRGIRLKTVSRLTLLFALTCLGAFVAGRPPVAGESQVLSTAQVAKSAPAGGSSRLALRNNDAGRVALRLRR